MVGSIGRSGAIVSAALALLLLFRLLVPTGYMIARDAGGAPRLVLCVPKGQPAAEAEGHGDHDRAPAEQAPAGSGERPCAFAALGAPPLPPAPPALPDQALPVAAPPGLIAAAVFRRAAPAVSPPPATGPPLPV
jgi:hypothetical protein